MKYINKFLEGFFETLGVIAAFALLILILEMIK